VADKSLLASTSSLQKYMHPFMCRYVINDWICPGIGRLLDTIQAAPVSFRRQQLFALAKILGKEWENWESTGLLVASYRVQLTTKAPRSHLRLLTQQPGNLGASQADKDSGPQQQQLSAAAVSYLPGGTLPSSFLLSLQQLPWLVSNKGEAHIPSQLFQPGPYFSDLFRDKMQYTAADLPPAMASKLGIRSEVSPELVLDVLLDWSQHALTLRPAPAGVGVVGRPSSGGGPTQEQQQQEHEAAGRAAQPASTAAASAGGMEEICQQRVGFKASLDQMNKIYDYLSKMIGYDRLPDNGYETLRSADASSGSRLGSGDSSAEGKSLKRLHACELFEKHPLIWLPDGEAIAAALQEAARQRGRHLVDPKHSKHSKQPRGSATADLPPLMPLLHDQELMGHVALEQLQGSFYGREALRFQDDARVIEQLPSSHATSQSLEAKQFSGLRVMGPYYPSLMQVFSALYCGPNIPQLQRYLPANTRFQATWLPLVGMYPTVCLLEVALGFSIWLSSGYICDMPLFAIKSAVLSYMKCLAFQMSCPHFFNLTMWHRRATLGSNNKCCDRGHDGLRVCADCQFTCTHEPQLPKAAGQNRIRGIYMACVASFLAVTTFFL
jgi:hypothetical protein